MHDLISDLRLSFRQLSRAPGFTAAAVLVLALGIGLNAAVFGLAHTLAFAGRPFRAPDEMVQLYSRHRTEPESYRPFSYGAYRVIGDRSDVFSGVAAHTLDMVGVRERAGDPRRTFAAFVSANYFDVLGVPIARGRAFTADEGRPGSAIPVAIASHAYWQRSGGAADLVGRTVFVNERPVTIVGITPPGFSGTMVVFGPELFLPLGLHDALGSDLGRETTRLADPAAFALFLVGRRAPGVPLDAAPQRLGATAAAVAEALPGEYRDREIFVAALPRFGTSTSPMNESSLTRLALVFLGLTGAVLLVVCLNLATVLIARGQARRREFAIRLALGAGRLRLVRQLLIEALVLGLAGAVGGVLLGLPAVDALRTALFARLPVAFAVDADITQATMIGALLFGALSAVMFALGPALAHTRGHGSRDLKHQVGDDAPTTRPRWYLPRHRLVAVQVALSLALLVAAGLFVRLAREGTAVDVGARAGDTVVVDVDASLAGDDEARALPQYAALETRLAALPGVEAASVGVTIPFGTTSFGEGVRRAGTRPAAGERPSTPEAGRTFNATSNAVGASYPRVMGLTILRGRAFTDAEAQRAGAPRVAIVDDVLARQLWPDGDAVGQSIHIGDVSESVDETPQPSVEIVGVVSRLNDQMFSKTPRGAVYVPFAQGFRSSIYFHVRPRPGSEAGLTERVRQELQAAAPALPIFGATTFGAHLATSIEFWGLKALAAAMTSVGLFAALIALVGVYGAVAYAVARRSREIGVRLAVGATPGTVERMIVAEGVRVGLVGAGAGLLLSLGVGRLLDALFVDIASFDWVLFTVAPLLLVAACAAAAWVPARRAAAVDPSHVLRA